MTSSARRPVQSLDTQAGSVWSEGQHICPSGTNTVELLVALQTGASFVLATIGSVHWQLSIYHFSLQVVESAWLAMQSSGVVMVKLLATLQGVLLSCKPVSNLCRVQTAELSAQARIPACP